MKTKRTDMAVPDKAALSLLILKMFVKTFFEKIPAPFSKRQNRNEVLRLRQSSYFIFSISS